MGANAFPLQKIPGFEATDYALLHGRIVWVGEAAVEHPRNLHAPWFQPVRSHDAERLRAGAALALAHWRSRLASGSSQPKGLLCWLLGQSLPFPFQAAATRFDAIAAALQVGDGEVLELSCLRVLGLGPGLTPSGDDFVGGLMFALRHVQPIHLPLERICSAIRFAAHHPDHPATNPISAALLDDLLDGRSHRPLHNLLAALEAQDATKIEASCDHLAQIGSTSGFDMLAGILTALTSPQAPPVPAS